MASERGEGAATQTLRLDVHSYDFQRDVVSVLQKSWMLVFDQQHKLKGWAEPQDTHHEEGMHGAEVRAPAIAQNTALKMLRLKGCK